MKNLEKILLIGLTFFIPEVAFSQQIDNSLEKSALHVSEEKINYYSRIPNEFNLSYEIENIKVSKRVTISSCDNSDYINMIDPESIKHYTSKFCASRKNNVQIAKMFFDALKYHGLKYQHDPQDAPWESQKDYADYLLARVFHEGDISLASTSIPLILDSSPKDYLKDPLKTLWDRKGDCEEMAALYASCLKAKGIQVGLVRFYKEEIMIMRSEMDPSLEDTIKVYTGHIMPIFKVEEEISEPSHKIILPDQTCWIPIEAVAIPSLSFENAIEAGFNKFKEYSSFDFLFLKE